MFSFSFNWQRKFFIGQTKKRLFFSALNWFWGAEWQIFVLQNSTTQQITEWHTYDINYKKKYKNKHESENFCCYLAKHQLPIFETKDLNSSECLLTIIQFYCWSLVYILQYKKNMISPMYIWALNCMLEFGIDCWIKW